MGVSYSDRIFLFLKRIARSSEKAVALAIKEQQKHQKSSNLPWQVRDKGSDYDACSWTEMFEVSYVQFIQINYRILHYFKTSYIRYHTKVLNLPLPL